MTGTQIDLYKVMTLNSDPVDHLTGRFDATFLWLKTFVLLSH